MNNESLSVDKEQLKRPALKQAHVDRLERSGLTLSAYSQMTGIGKSTLCQWRKQYGKAESAVQIFITAAGHLSNLFCDRPLVKLIKELKQWN